MKINCLGGGPAGLFFALLMKKRFPDAEITVIERNRPDDTFGFGVVFSDQTMLNLSAYDDAAHAEISAHFAHWDAIDTQFKGHLIRCNGHGFAGIARVVLLGILQRRCRALGVRLCYETEVEDVDAWRDCDLLVGADGINSAVRARYADRFGPDLRWCRNRFSWLGAEKVWPTFYYTFRETSHGLFFGSAYQSDARLSTWVAEVPEAAWLSAGLDRADEADTIAFLEEVHAEDLRGARLLGNNSVWRRFPVVRNACWSHENIVLMGDAAHSAHYTIGSGTKLALEDAMALYDAFDENAGAPIATVLARYEAQRRPLVESMQRAAQASLEWYEHVDWYWHQPPLQFVFGLLCRSMRVSHENLRRRDPEFVDRVDRWYVGAAAGDPEPPPPMFTPFRLRGLTLANRVVVSPMATYSAEDGMPGPFHLVHLGNLALGGAGLVFTEMTHVTREARITPGCTGLYRPEHVAAWRRIVDFVHRHSDAKIGIQIGHAGRKGSTRIGWEGMDEPLKVGNWEVVSASPIAYSPHNQVPREASRADMDAVRDAHVGAARMAEDAGFDMLEIHMAHGYFLSSFISPLTNGRRDAYGGALEARMRYPLDVFAAVRAVWPAHKPMAVRISATDWCAGGTDADDAVEIARLFKAAGCDIIDVSTGQTTLEARPAYGRMYQTPFAERIRHLAGIPVMAVGAISSFEDVNANIVAGRADLCCLGRAHLYDPYFARHAAQTMGHEGLSWPRQYASLARFRPA